MHRKAYATDNMKEKSDVFFENFDFSKRKKTTQHEFSFRKEIMFMFISNALNNKKRSNLSQ